MIKDNFPSVGAICEYTNNPTIGKWHKIEVLKFDEEKKRYACIALSDQGMIKKGDIFWLYDYVEFRQIKSEAELFVERLTPLLNFDIFTGQVTASFLWGIGLRFKD